MTEWISVNEKLPKLFEVVWIYWKDREVLLGCRVDLDSEPSEGWYSFEDDKCRWSNWWIPVDYYTFDKPNGPDK